ncbi:Gfo/Idh/MocA family oxidoreductase [Zobellia galactanivorans]|uniref:NAD(P)-dependent dehydrogenase n=1 Tax=Zobellia galactanivorans (strain DSM 12802 / CCUG 47099 / CIP 106680 / NCIMB 13871 / Dsij) TaxID=63186 RepID=G0L654_ZOBGA|nr:MULTISPECIES: Gfo/Idh/MocA family oxidoreductase [Zobellia]MBU3027651.1 Gfo/Idh/MocA family oxidoreductase [Zobellia galactanivorans]MDO6807032.1 Gfo/Idh/MocA family oxidoreductase [Zobellia galactanivorans]OWW23936.1 oxidoreductase [Zobellia sp. OII3]CAZ96724.1 NAD(P)-dependent dehydrogenase [Zobellia galactanivorans]
MNKREFLKNAATLSTITLLPSGAMAFSKSKKKRLRTAHIGVGNMGGEDLKAISSHAAVDVVALCDVDSELLAKAKALHPDAKTYTDYRVMLKEMKKKIDAVVVSTPDHTHAPASMMAMEMDKPVYCQKPLTHHVTEARAMKKLAKEKNLVTQMGIQVHSFYDYKLATLMIQSGIIGKVHTVRAWSPKNWGYDGPLPEGQDPVPANLDWNLWLGTSSERPYKKGVYHPGNWRKLVDYGCGTLGDMGVHIFDTPYNALELDVPRTITTNCRKPNGFGYPEQNMVTYEFPGTKYTADTLKWVWYDGEGADKQREDLMLPGGEKLHDQGAMFIGEKGRLYLPHFQMLPKVIVDGEYQEIDVEKFNLGEPVRDYESEGKKHYHQFVDACLGTAETSAPFSYASRLTETILLGVIAGRFPNKTLHWDAKSARFAEDEANQFLDSPYREF